MERPSLNQNQSQTNDKNIDFFFPKDMTMWPMLKTTVLAQPRMTTQRLNSTPVCCLTNSNVMRRQGLAFKTIKVEWDSILGNPKRPSAKWVTHLTTTTVCDYPKFLWLKLSKLLMDGWLAIYILFNSFSVISGWWQGDNERLCAMESRSQLERFPPSTGFEPGTATSIGQYLTYWATRATTKLWTS